MSFHELSSRGDVHGIHYWTFPTYAARLAHSPSEGPTRLPNASDVTHKRVCLVLEDFSFHALFGYDPVEWRPLCGEGERLQLSVPSLVTIRDLVYISGTGAADRADNSIPGRSPIIGVVIAKIGDTIALVNCQGIISGYSGFIAGDNLFLGVDGGIITPPLPTTFGTTIQKIGQAISDSVILLYPDQPILL